MSSNEDFKLITYKRNRNKIISPNKFGILKEACTIPPLYEKRDSTERVNLAKEDLLKSNFYSSITASLREALDILHKPLVSEIVCFGLGNIEDCMIARYQLAFLLCIKDLYNAPIYVYDPIYGVTEEDLLSNFDISVLKTNCEGKYRIKDNNTTLFYLPHCPKQLSNNLLWANWGFQLTRCVIVSNSFNKIVESNALRIIRENAQYILKILPHVTELPIINCFKYFDIFNDTAVHIFPHEVISLISEDLWQYCVEPKYSKLDTEFITN